MRTAHIIILIGLSLLSLSSESFAQSGTCAGMDTGRGADLNGFIPFPADNAWNTDISSMPVDPNSDNIIAFIGASSPLHPDFGQDSTMAVRLVFRTRWWTPRPSQRFRSGLSPTGLSLTLARCLFLQMLSLR